MSPDGVRLDHGRAAALALLPRVLIVCGRYEGIDERVRGLGLFDEEISLGDFVLPGGEAAALALTECVTRLVPGVVGASESLENESFFRDRLDYPHYTRPREFRGAGGAGGAPVRRPSEDREVAAGPCARTHPAAAARPARAAAGRAGRRGGGLARAYRTDRA